MPGSWQAQGIGKPEGNLRNSYSGPAWYRREIAIPASWQGKIIRLRVGGALRTTTLFVNGRTVGQHDGFSTPFSFDVSAYAHPGAQNTIALRIENPGGNLRDSPDKQVSTQPAGMINYIGNWGGIYGAIELEATSSSWIDQVAITPEISEQRASFSITLGGKVVPGSLLEVVVGSYRTTGRVTDAAAQPTSISLAMPGVRLWSPDSPMLYHAHLSLLHGQEELDRTEQSFGMREIKTSGRVLLLNGKPLYLRGYGDDNVEVLTGVPPSSKQVALERVKLARSFGFNAVRFHSMVPTEPFLQAADEAGLLVMAELPAAYTMHFLPHREYLRQELERTLRTYRNHPSFLSLGFGNEFNLEWLKSPEDRKEFQTTVDEFYRFAKSIDPHRLILSNDGLLLRPSDLFSLYKGAPPDAPTVRHEFGEYYCSLPDVGLIPQFTGVIKPTWLEEKQKWIRDNGLENSYPGFLENSKKLQQIGRKYQIERVRRDPEVSGYHYWLGTDYPGGTGEGDSWEEGWFDYFWHPKSITPSQGQEINSSVLMMIDAGVEKRTFWNDEAQRIGLTISNYGESSIQNGSVSWKLISSGRALSSGSLSNVNVSLGQVAQVGTIQIPPPGDPLARKLELVAEMTVGNQSFGNRWSFWSFPHHAELASTSIPVLADGHLQDLQHQDPFVQEKAGEPLPGALLITETLTPSALEFLQSGGKVWLMAGEAAFRHPGDMTFFPASGGAIGSQIPAIQPSVDFRMRDSSTFNSSTCCKIPGICPLTVYPATFVQSPERFERLPPS